MSAVTELDQVEKVPALPTLHRNSSYDGDLKEKRQSSLDDVKEEASHPSEDGYDQVQYLKGEPVIKSGLDVSRFVVDIRDDEDAALTFRSLVLGTVLAGLGAALSQVKCHYVGHLLLIVLT